jgi:hypothetical protein
MDRQLARDEEQPASSTSALARRRDALKPAVVEDARTLSVDDIAFIFECQQERVRRQMKISGLGALLVGVVGAIVLMVVSGSPVAPYVLVPTAALAAWAAARRTRRHALLELGVSESAMRQLERALRSAIVRRTVSVGEQDPKVIAARVRAELDRVSDDREQTRR